MVTPEDIRKKALAKYPDFLKNEYSDEKTAFFPLHIRCDKSMDFSSLKELESAITGLQSASKEKKKFGYTVCYTERNTKGFGKQNVPSLIRIDTETDFLKFTGMEELTAKFRDLTNRTLAEFPELGKCMAKNYKTVTKYHDQWESVLKVCRFFRSNPKPGKFVRELGIGVHTKFVEDSRDVLRPLLDVIVGNQVNESADTFFGRFNMKEGDPTISFRVLDKELCRKYLSGFTYNTVFVCEFSKFNIPVKNVIIVENMRNLHKVIELVPEKKDTLIVWGSGYNVTVLKYVGWLNNVNLYYWGDIDAQGYEILSTLRKYFPHAVSIMMDKKALNIHPIPVNGTVSKVTRPLRLSDEESEIYHFVKEGNLRFEQEFMPEFYVHECLDKIL